MSRCPTCGHESRRGAQADLASVRPRTCWACGKSFVQLGPGRSRIVCGSKACARKRERYCRRGEAALDRMEG